MARNPSPNDNPSDCYPISPDNDADLPTPISGIAFSAAGALHIETRDGIERTIPSGVLAAGIIHPIGIRRVYATGTTVSDPVGFVNAGMGVV